MACLLGKSRDLESAGTLLVLGERIMDSGFQIAVMYQMICKRLRGLTGTESTSLPPSTIVNIIYKGTTERSPSRRLMVDLCVWSGSEVWKCMKSFGEETNVDFNNDLIQALLDQRAPPRGGGIARPWIQNMRSYIKPLERDIEVICVFRLF